MQMSSQTEGANAGTRNESLKVKSKERKQK